ncbi:unnamed protein product, partial [marine sediment metagenome]
GIWNDGEFVAGKSNFYSQEELSGYFDEFEKGTKLVDNRDQLSQTEKLAARLRDDESDYSYVMSNIDAMQEAQNKGDRGAGEAIRENLDPQGDNVFGRILAGLTSSAVGAGIVAIGAASNPVGWGLIAIAAIGAGLTAVGTNKAALWVSEKDERDIREDLLKLNANTFETDAEREETEMRVADWYNEKNIERFRKDKWSGMLANGILETLAYGSEFAFGAGIATGARKGLSIAATGLAKKAVKEGAEGVLGKIAKEGAEAALGKTILTKSAKLAITPDQAKTILRRAPKVALRQPGVDIGDVYGQMMNNVFQRNLRAFFGKKSTQLGISGAATFVSQQPRLFTELRSDQLDKVDVKPD